MPASYAGALDALAQGSRLEVLRLLVQAGLVVSRQESRSIYYSASLQAMHDLIPFVGENCCGGRECLPAATAARCRGIGAALLAHVEQAAARMGMERLVLLTQTADRFFAHRGYMIVERNAVPDTIRESSEFRTLCPASAVCMAWHLPLERAGAGSFPIGRVNPYADEALGQAGLPTEGLRSKSWDEFARLGAPAMDFVFTVCDASWK